MGTHNAPRTGRMAVVRDSGSEGLAQDWTQTVSRSEMAMAMEPEQALEKMGQTEKRLEIVLLVPLGSLLPFVNESLSVRCKYPACPRLLMRQPCLVEGPLQWILRLSQDLGAD